MNANSAIAVTSLFYVTADAAEARDEVGSPGGGEPDRVVAERHRQCTLVNLEASCRDDDRDLASCRSGIRFGGQAAQRRLDRAGTAGRRAGRCSRNRRQDRIELAGRAHDPASDPGAQYESSSANAT
jgi:hypothetical protein